MALCEKERPCKECKRYLKRMHDGLDPGEGYARNGTDCDGCYQIYFIPLPQPPPLPVQQQFGLIVKSMVNAVGPIN